MLKITVGWCTAVLVSTGAIAQADTTHIEDISKKIVSQTSVIFAAYSNNNVSTENSVYESIWEGEFSAVDAIDTVTDALNLYKQIDVNNKFKSLSQTKTLLISQRMQRACEINLAHLKEGLKAIKHPAVKIQVTTQVANVDQGCRALKEIENELTIQDQNGRQ